MCVCLWDSISCNVKEEDKEEKRKIGVDMGLNMVGEQRLVGATIAQGWLGISVNK